MSQAGRTMLTSGTCSALSTVCFTVVITTLLATGCDIGTGEFAIETQSESPSDAAALDEDLMTISADELWSVIDSGQPVFVFDTNRKERWEKSHVPGATWIDFESVELTQLPEDPTAQLVFYCANLVCPASQISARAAMDLGYENVMIMPEGIAGWEEKGLPVNSASS